jgi:DNA-binding NtrC family response regulator
MCTTVVRRLPHSAEGEIRGKTNADSDRQGLFFVGRWDVKTILVVDDDADATELLAEGLAAPGRVVRAFSDPMRALAALEREPADLVIADLSMPWITGREVAGAVLKRRPGCKLFLISGHDEGEAVAKGMGIPFFAKPIDLGRLRYAVDQALYEQDVSQPSWTGPGSGTGPG